MSKSEKKQVIAHYIDGTLVRGITHDFYPTEDTFHVTETDGTDQEVIVAGLKAVFFVKELSGNSDYDEKKGVFADESNEMRVLIEFFDGEVLFGYAVDYNATGLGFFMYPGDPDSNNTKVFVVNTATKRVKTKRVRRLNTKA